MTGPLVLPADPVSANQAADKNYVDENIAATAGGLGQKVSLLPTANQTVAQPSGTNFSISGVSASTSFGGSGTSSQSTITSGNTAASPNTGTYSLLTNQSNCFESGYDLGNNGSAAQGWSDCHLESDTLESATRGISQLHSGNFSHFAQGDTAAFYTYLTSFGGNVATSDEAVTHTVEHTNQIGYYSGIVATGGTTGSKLLTTTSFTCHGFCGTLDNNQFADGGILLDTSKGGSTATLATQGSAMNGLYYTLASGTVPVSTAWGNIIPSSCTNNGNGQWQNYTTTTCNVTLGTSPASPNNFVAGTDACFAGPFQEEAAVTAVGSPSAGVQSITFNTRYAWNSLNVALVMQGGSCGESLVATNGASSWPVAYAVVGATSPTQVFFSNCVIGNCNGGGNIIQPANATSQPVLTRAANVVTASPNPYNIPNLNSFPSGSTIIVSGYTPSDLNGTFTVVTNSLDNQNPSITWAQAGTNETSSVAGTIAQPPASITFYPSAFITGTNNGAYGNAQLATNQVPFATGDTVVGAPTSQFQNSGLNIYIGQSTPPTGGWASQGVMVDDEGPSQLTYSYTALNTVSNGPSAGMFNIRGSYDNDFYIGYRPANNGAILYVQGGEPVSPNHKPYYIFEDNAGGGLFGYDPLHYNFTLNQPLKGISITATAAASAFASGTTIGGSLPCLQNGTNCPAGSGSVAAATMPPLTYTYFPAAVSDGGAAYAGAFTRYSNNEPQAGSVESASSALGYLLFQATPIQPQYAELTTLAPPFWTGSGVYLNFYSTATSGNAVLDVQTACVTPGAVVGSPSFSTAIITTSAVSSTANGLVRTALIPSIATPGVNGCPASGMTTPTMLTIRVFADATSSVPVYFTGATLVTGRSQ